ncbi:M23 family metallopeptidase [Pseudokineococcus marinus]|uniref:M23 family metallopeptidase n=1 Tax=Pseudokineococcus marinus TaxID=351215 RepID=A0A849BLQ9_9ACTN|nr:M23 family metallopeptidase [Pseudokineococcus marinus]NNH24130.1 M23 family metallopeptidase [Pseudokineococcus marinus]
MLAASALALTTSLLAVPAAAAPEASQPEERKAAVDAALSTLQQDLVGTSEELQGAYAEYAAVQQQLPGARSAADAARSERSRARAEADELAQRLASSTAAQEAAAEAVAGTEEAMAEHRTSVGRIAASSYRGNGMPEMLALAMGSASTDDLASRSAALAGLSTTQSAVLADLSSEQAVRTSARARLEAVTEQVADLEAEAERQLVRAQAAEAAAEARQREVEDLVARQDRAVAVIEARQAEEEERLDALQAESDALGAQLRAIAEEERRVAAEQEAAREAERQAAREAEERAAREAEERAAQEQAAQQASQGSSGSSTGSRAAAAPAAAPAPPSAVSRGSSSDRGGRLLRPEGRLSSPFGMRMHPIRGYLRMHNGQDFAAGCGTPVRAAEDGTVVSAGYNGSYGNIVVVSHGLMDGRSVATAYAHLQGFAVRSGSVSRGQVIGYEGTTGGSTGCHLHFEVRVDGAPTDPMAWL